MIFIRNFITLLSILLVVLLFSACRKLDKEGPATATVSIKVNHSRSSSRMTGINRSYTPDNDTELIALVTDETTFNQEYLSLENPYQFALTDLSTNTVTLTVPLDTGIKLYSYGYFDDIFTVSELENTATQAEQFGETNSFTISSGDTSKYVYLTIIEYISISSSASDNATVEFGQTYQHQITTSGTYSGTLTYSLSNQPDNMTISSSGLVEWTPTRASEITTHSAVVITITTASGYVLTETYDLSVTGTCTSGNVLSIWSGDQRSSTDSSSYLGNITAYTDNSSSVKTASANYNYSSSSINLTHGPVASATKGNVFFYNQYNDTDNLYLFWMFGVNGSSVANNVHLDVYTAKNESSDNLVVSDDSGETNRESQSTSGSLYSSTYTGRYKYVSCCSDGGVIGPFSGSSFRVFIDLTGTSSLTSTHSTTSAEDLTASGVSGYDLGTGNLDSFTYWSKDGSSFSLGDTDNFTVGYSTSLDCSN